MKKFLFVCLSFLLLLSFAGCASMGDFWASHGARLEYLYNPRIDKWTYDDVLKEMSAKEKWEMPTSVLYSLTRDIIWITFKNMQETTGQTTVYHTGSFLTEATSESKTVSMQQGVLYSFVFDKKTKILKWFQYLHYEEGSLFDKGESGDKSFAPRGGEQFSSAADAKAGTTSSAISLEQKLKELKDLKDKKVITDEEYEKMREKALNDFK